jgi:hypothetical protein
MKERKEARTSAADGVSPVKAAAPSSNVALNDHAIRREAKRQVAVMASAQPPATTNVENPSAVKAERQEERSGNALGAAAIPAPPQPSAPAALSAPTSELGAMAKETGEPQAGPAAPRATTQSVAVTGGMSSGQAESVPAKTDSSRTSLSGLHVEPAAPTLAMRASHKGVKVAAGSPNTLWSVSSTGIVHRSTDGGRTLEEVHVAPGISFHAIASRGNNVWAGGTGGALFHSTDGGATWARVAVNPGGNTITEAIISIQMRDALRLTVTFATGVQWTTEDGGQQWQMKP